MGVKVMDDVINGNAPDYHERVAEKLGGWKTGLKNDWDCRCRLTPIEDPALAERFLACLAEEADTLRIVG